MTEVKGTLPGGLDEMQENSKTRSGDELVEEEEDDEPPIPLQENYNSKQMLTWLQPIKQPAGGEHAVTDQSLHIDKYIDPGFGVTITNHDEKGRPTVR